MAISSYLKRCGYQQNELKNVLYLIPKTATKKVHIDGDEAYVEYSGDTSSIIKIKGNNLAFQEDTSFDDRFRFDKTITLTVDGYITFKDFYSKYYAIVEDKSGTFWMVNADFPSYITYTYTLNDGENKTDLVFYAASNIPTIKLANFNPDNAEECETYMPYGIENLKLLEKNKTKLSTYNKTVSTHDDFKYVEAIDGTYELVEEFNGETYSTQLSFSIPLSVYKASWHVKLLEFEKNKYCGYLILKNSDYKAFLGYNTGLFPSYVINGDIVTITLTESSNYGMVFDDDYHIFEPIYRWTRTNDTSCMEVTNTLWRESGTTCVGANKYIASVLKVSYDSGSTYYNTNVVSGTTLIEANSYECGYRVRWVDSGTTCVNYSKFVNSYKQISYDSGSTWITPQPLQYSATTLIEANSPECGYSPKVNQYLTFVPREDSVFSINGATGTGVYSDSYAYSLDSGTTWSILQPGEETPIIHSGETIMWKENSIVSTVYPTFNCVYGSFDVEGNIMSLVYGDNFSGQTTLGYIAFIGLFSNCTTLVNANQMALPALKTSVSYAYESMFKGCTSLLTAPYLPATKLSFRCYRFMFQGCTSLISVPDIPAMELAGGCCEYMFSGCTSLTKAPNLPALSAATSCYGGMFQGCTSLTKVPSQLPATTLLDYCYQYMFQGCTSLKNVPSNFLPAQNLRVMCYYYMFQGCTSLEASPILYKTHQCSYCYMFSGCTSLNTVTCLITEKHGDSETRGWLAGVAANGTFIKNKNMTIEKWQDGGSGIPSGWTVIDYTE